MLRLCLFILIILLCSCGTTNAQATVQNLTSDLLLKKAEQAFYASDYNQAFDLNRMAFKTSKTEKKKENQIKAYHQIAANFTDYAQYDSTELYLTKAANLIKQNFTETHWLNAENKREWANLYVWKNSEKEKAINLIDEVIYLIKIHNPDKLSLLPKAYLVAAFANYSKRQYTTAHNWVEEGLKVCKELYVNKNDKVEKRVENIKSPEIAWLLNYKGMIYAYEITLFPSLRDKDLKADDFKNRKTKIDSSLKYINQSKKIFEDLYGTTCFGVGKCFHNLGNLYSIQATRMYSRQSEERKKMLEISNAYFEKAIQINESIFGEKHPYIVNPLHCIGLNYTNLNNHQKAFEYNEKAVASSIYDYPTEEAKSKAFGVVPQITNHTMNPYIVGYVSSLKMGIIHRMYKENKDSDLLNNMEQLNKELQIWTEYKLNNTTSLKDKKGLLHRYEETINRSNFILWEHYQKDQKKQYINAVFQSIEKGKYNLLKKKQLENKSKQSAGIPTLILNQRDSLITQIKLLTNTLNKLNDNGLTLQKTQNQAAHTAEQNDILKARYDLAKTQNLLLELQTKIEQNYQSISFDDFENYSIEDIQKELKEDQVLIHFCARTWGTYVELYAVAISRYSTKLHRFEDEDGVFLDHLKKLKEFYENVSENDVNAYSEHALYLYNKTLAPLESVFEDKKELILIPQNILTDIPFEALMSKKLNSELASEKIGFDKVSFLIDEFKISVQLSSNLWMKTLKRQHTQNNPETMDIYAMAPQITTSYNQDPIRLRLDEVYYATSEIKEIEQLVDGKFMYDLAATEQHFNKHAHDANIIHIASHTAILDSSNQKRFCIVLAPDSTNQTDGYLQDFEIYDNNYQAELVILSTCQSAVGETASGEGIMNLVYAFMSSGVHCVSATLWQVLDESTRTITKGFYQRLKAGDDKTTALHAAKKQFLNDARFINDANLAHPRNWAGIQIVGDMRPLKLSEASNNNWLYRLTDNVKGKMRGVWQYILGTIVLTIGIFRKRLFKT